MGLHGLAQHDGPHGPLKSGRRGPKFENHVPPISLSDAQRLSATAMEGSFLKLIIEKGPRGGETLEYQPGSAIRIGRVVNNLPIKDSDISSKHLSFNSNPVNG